MLGRLPVDVSVVECEHPGLELLGRWFPGLGAGLCEGQQRPWW